MNLSRLLTLAVLLPALAACGGDDPGDGASSGTTPDDHGHAHAEGPHGGLVVDASDHAAHFEILHDAEALRVDLYVFDADMQPLDLDETPVLNLVHKGKSASVEGEGEGHHWTFSNWRLNQEPEGRFRLKIGGKTYLPPFEHAHGVHGHDHDAHGPHDGVVAAFGPAAGEGAGGGWIELKLHDDLGDLELWIAKDEAITEPLDLPVDAQVTVLFHDQDGRKVPLAVRDRETNEDEDGVANLRATGTNYFIFPGETGADATWLCGADFEARVTVSFEHAGVKFATKVFELRPHTHGAGGHDHK